MFKKINKEKVRKAIEVTEEWIKRAEAKGVKDTFDDKNGNRGATILWCEKRNLKLYKKMLNLTYFKELGSLKELYKAI